MIHNTSWSTIATVDEQLKADGYSSDKPIHVNFLIRGRKNSDTRRLKFADFLAFMWRLFDQKIVVDYVQVSKPDGTEVLNTLPQDVQRHGANEMKPTKGNGDLVRYWNKRTQKEQDAHLKVLWSQIASELFPVRNGNG